MKSLYFLIVAMSLSFLSLAQTEGASKIYGYKQKLMGGTIRVDENGQELPRQPKYNYFIYLASTTKVIPVEIWINGEPYSVSVREVSSPVEYVHPTSGNNTPKILVPKTTRKILQLGLANKIQKPITKGKSLSSKNELVIIYKGQNKLYYKGQNKLYYKSLSKLSVLEPLSMQ